MNPECKRRKTLRQVLLSLSFKSLLWFDPFCVFAQWTTVHHYCLESRSESEEKKDVFWWSCMTWPQSKVTFRTRRVCYTVSTQICYRVCIHALKMSMCSSVRPKLGFGIGNRNQDQVSVSVSGPELFLPKPKLSSIFSSLILFLHKWKKVKEIWKLHFT